jgi:PAS domain S-box-containing protein
MRLVFYHAFSGSRDNGRAIKSIGCRGVISIMWQTRRNLTPAMVSVLGCALLVLVQRNLDEAFGGLLTSLIFLGTILIAAILGGWKSGALAIGLGIFSAVFLFSPPYLVRIASDGVELLRLLTFILLGSVLSAICELLQLAWRRIDERQRQLEEEVKERRRAQIAEQNRADELMTTLTSIGDGVIRTDFEGRVTFLNPVAEELVGWKTEQAKGRELPEVFHIVNEATHQPVANPAVRALREGVIVGLAIDDSAAPIRDASGKVIGSVLVFRDVSEKKRAEVEREHLLKKVQAANDQLDDIFHRAPAFICVLRGPDHVFEIVNERYRRLIGHREVIGKTVRDALPEIADQGYPELLDQVYRTGEPFVGTDMRVLIQLANDGHLTELYLDFVYLPVLDSSGAVTGILVHGIDLTDKKTAAIELARVTAESDRRKRLYETVLSSTPDFVYVFDLEHRFTYCNDSLLAMLGKASDEAAGKSFLELGYEPWHAEMHSREIDQVVSTKLPIRGEVPFTGTNGKRIYDYIFVPVFGADGEVEAVAGTTRDVTDRKRAEEAIKEADRKKDDFIALLAHELRNPLAPIRNGLQILRLSKNDSDISEQARTMMDRQLAHMVRLVDDLLDVSRVGRNKMELRLNRVSISEVFANAVETVRPMIEDAEHELTISLPSQELFLHADLTRLSQVFGNLLANSAKYTERGGHIWLTAMAGVGEVTISIRDTGIGIPAEALPTIFDMFAQVDRPIERNSGGLGIGLALVKGLVEMHDGHVQAQSDGQGRGSTFTVTLPLLQDNRVDPAATLPGIEHPSSISKRRILVVDDNHDGAESLAMMLQLEGNEIATAHDGVDAVERAQQFRPAVILMDLGMPRLNGLDATRQIREQSWGQNVKIIALTGWGQDNDRAQSRAAGCDGHLVKPVSLPDLQKMLGEIG